MKKALSLCMALFLSLALFTGCSNGASTPSPSAGTTSESTPVDSSSVSSTDFPNSPVKIIVARKAGGSADMVARMYAPYLQKALGVNVVVENVDGGSGKIGLSQAFRAAPDGYTLVLGNFPSYVLTQHIEGGVDYVMSDFEPIVGVSGNEGNVLIVPGDSPFNSVEELLAYDQENPGKLNMAVTSGLSNSSLAQAMFISQTKLQSATIPYDDGNSCVTAVMGKHVDMAVCSGVAAYQPASDGTIKVLCTFGPEEDDKLPDVPTFASMYGEEYAYDVVMGILAPPETPEDVLAILREAGLDAAQDPEFAAAAGDSFTVVPRNDEELAEVISGCYDLADSVKDLLASN